MQFVGLYFVRYNEQGTPLCHGKILSRVEPGYYLAETGTGFIPNDTDTVLFHISDMKNWVFFEESEDLGAYVEHYVMPVVEDNYKHSKTKQEEVNKSEFVGQSINKIMRTHKPGRCLLRAKGCIHTYFTPFLYDEVRDEWWGARRWYGSSSQIIETVARDGTANLWTVAKEKCPILPVRHRVRREIAVKKSIFEGRDQLENQQNRITKNES